MTGPGAAAYEPERAIIGAAVYDPEVIGAAVYDPDITVGGT